MRAIAGQGARILAILAALFTIENAWSAAARCTGNDYLKMREQGLSFEKIKEVCAKKSSTSGSMEITKKTSAANDSSASATVDQPEPSSKLGPTSGAAKSWVEPTTGMVFVAIPAGCFMMGSRAEEQNVNRDEQPQHEVCVSNFWLAQYETTQKQWQTVMKSNPSQAMRGDDFPVDSVSWEEAQGFVSKLNQANDSKVLRLPTEAEWEYAARAGLATATYWGSDDSTACQHANLYDLSSKQQNKFAWRAFPCNDGAALTAPVGRLKANPFGLYDLLGNVWEWVQDTYQEDAYKQHKRDNPVHETPTPARVLRGGSWSNIPNTSRITYRNWKKPDAKTNAFGLRLARSP